MDTPGRAPDRLAEDQDDQQGEPFRQVLDLQRQPVLAEGGEDRPDGVDQYRNRQSTYLAFPGTASETAHSEALRLIVNR